MEEKYQKLHQQFFYCMLVLIAFFSAFDVAVYFTSYRNHVSWTNYSDWHFWMPLVISVAGVVAMRSVLESPNVSLLWKKYSTIIYLDLLCTVFSIAHAQEFPVLLCCFLLPILWSSTYGKKNITVVAHLLSQGCLSLFWIFYLITKNMNCGLNAFVTMIILLFSRFLTVTLMDFIREKDDIIRSHMQNNENLGERLLREPMTGLYNHAAFHSLLEQKIRERGQNPLTLAIVDIDNFKRVNDTFGHNNGDKVILALAEVLKKHFGEKYYPCRYGGEEFAVIFPGLKGKEAKAKMEEALAEFRSLNYDWHTGPAITFSCGVFQHSEFNMSAAELFRITDQMLYKAKQNGKNCCVSGL